MCELHRFAVYSLTFFTVAVVHAQPPGGADEAESTLDPDIVAIEEFVREIREEAEAARQGPDEAPPEQVDRLVAGIEAETADPAISLEVRVLTQRALVSGLRQRYTDEHPTLVRAERRLEQLEAQLDRGDE